MRLQDTRGLVFFELRDKPPYLGETIARMRTGDEPPPFSARAWATAAMLAVGERGSLDLGGRWADVGRGRLEWKWNSLPTKGE